MKRLEQLAEGWKKRRFPLHTRGLVPSERAEAFLGGLVQTRCPVMGAEFREWLGEEVKKFDRSWTSAFIDELKRHDRIGHKTCVRCSLESSV